MQALIIQLLLGAIGPLLLAIIKDLRDRGAFDHAVEFARICVAKLAKDEVMGNDAKRKIATEAVKADLKAVGKDLADRSVSLAVEIAYNALRAGAVK